MLITISRQFGAGGSAVAQRVATELGWSLVDNEFVEQVAQRAGLPPQEVAEREERVLSFLDRLSLTLASSAPELFPPETGTAEDKDEVKVTRMTERLVAELAEEGRAVLVGRAAPAVLGQTGDALHVKLVAPVEFRLEQVCQRTPCDSEEAQERMERTDKNRARYHKKYYDRDWDDPANYDMVLNTGRLGFDGAVDVIVARARELWELGSRG